ncbi:Fc receptor-like protein 5 [Moschus berezovskii]|uniref:Fc receptor-like protein 5 n=1 Tax=Moschus berezovskii TaxID=68408 RepID=UPI002444C836|nr:Fc receptor-like protein 5 [Moschus berezovskii]
MLLWVSLLILAPVGGQFATEIKSVISLHPPWTTLFQGETVTLTCKAFKFNAPQKIKWYRWYLPGEIHHETTENTYEVRESGGYKCQAQDSHSSDRVDLLFSAANLILQAPFDVFEDDSVVLRCQAKANIVLNDMKLYKNGKILKILETTSDFHIHQASMKDNGEYYCSGVKDNHSISSNKIKIVVQELFPSPVLRASSTQPTEGDAVTLTCETQLSLQRPEGQLLFRFIKPSVRSKWKNSPEFQFSSIRGENSGFYWCEAQRVNSLVQKQSQALQIRVQVPVSQPVLTLSPPGTQTLVGNEVRLRCEVRRGSLPIWYQFFHEDVLLTRIEATSWRTKSYSFSVTAEHSGNYYCTADNGFGPQSSETINLSVIVPVSRPVLTLRAPRGQAVVGDTVELHCEAQRGSPPILYQFYHEDVTFGSSSSPSGGGASFNLILKTEHSGNYSCEANNGQGVQRSDTVLLSVRAPVSRPVLTLRTPRVQAVVGDVLEIHCETQRGSPPIQYKFYIEDVALGSCSSLSGGGTSFNLSLTAENSGNYSCEADNGLGVQRSEAVSLNVRVPVSDPVLTLRTARAQVVVGDVLELHCEAQRGSPPILYWFYHNNVTLETSMSHSGQGVSLNLSLTADHSGTYSCEADNGLGPQRSEAVTLSVMGLTGSKSNLIATSVTGGLLSMMAIAAVALLFYCWFLRKAGGKPTFDSSSRV